jgi:hypothetical protein
VLACDVDDSVPVCFCIGEVTVGDLVNAFWGDFSVL